jgi:hypothetical protein
MFIEPKPEEIKPMPESEISILFVGQPKFSLGKLVATPNALAQISHEDMQAALNRHIFGDWGLTDSHDTAENNRALEAGSRLFSVYDSSNQVRFWIITEWDRSSTCILLPEDY